MAPGRRIGRVLMGVVVSIVGIAGIAKAIDIGEFRNDLSSWTLVPEWAAPAVAVLVPSFEILAAGLWLVARRYRMAVALSGTLLLLFSAVYLAHLVWSEPPKCACLGRISAYYRHMDSVSFTIGRNAALALLLVVGWFMDRGARPQRQPRQLAPASAQSAGFTLVETMLVIALLGLLIVLSLPAISEFRRRADDAVSLSNLRQHGAVFASYTAEWKDCFPYFTHVDATYSVVRNPDRDFSLPMRYFDAHTFWNIALASGYYNGDHLLAAFAPPSSRSRQRAEGVWGTHTDYWYSCVFLADPAYWDLRTRQGASQWRPVRDHEVSFPAAKAVLFASRPWVNEEVVQHRAPRPRLIATVDGSAAGFSPAALLEQCEGGDGRTRGSAHFSSWMPALHTLNGTRGRDIRR